MLGTPAFLLFVMPLLFALGACAGAVASLRRQPRPKSFIMAVFLLLWASLAFVWCFRNLSSRLFLQHLSTASVADLRINGRSISDPATLGAVVSTLRSPLWYAENHPHYVESATMVITLKDGRDRFFVLSTLSTLPGVIVQFCSEATSSSPDRGCPYGGAYLRSFPRQLLGSGGSRTDDAFRKRQDDHDLHPPLEPRWPWGEQSAGHSVRNVDAQPEMGNADTSPFAPIWISAMVSRQG